MRIRIPITKSMLEYASEAAEVTAVNRTVTSPYDTVAGLLGELIFAEYVYQDFKKHNLYDTKGKSDFFNEIEIKTSAFPFRENLNLLVRADYAKKRKPKFYVQIILDIPTRNSKQIEPGVDGVICGFATAKDIDDAPLKDFGSKFGGRGGYQCHFIKINNLGDISEVKKYVQNVYLIS
jgi:hypothetical protein